MEDGWEVNKQKLLLLNKYAMSSKNGQRTCQIKYNGASLLVYHVTVIKLPHILCSLYIIINKDIIFILIIFNKDMIIILSLIRNHARNLKKNDKFFPMNTSYLMPSYTYTLTTVNSLMLLMILLALLSCFLIF